MLTAQLPYNFKSLDSIMHVRNQVLTHLSVDLGATSKYGKSEWKLKEFGTTLILVSTYIHFSQKKISENGYLCRPSAIIISLCIYVYLAALVLN
jgi:hypothetical protein